MTLRHGFKVEKGERAGLRGCCNDRWFCERGHRPAFGYGAEIVGVGSVVDRSNGKVDFGVPFHALLSMEVTSYEGRQLPALPGRKDSGHQAGKPQPGKIIEESKKTRKTASFVLVCFWNI